MEWLIEYTLNGFDCLRKTIHGTQDEAMAYATKHCGYMWTITPKGGATIIPPSLIKDMQFISDCHNTILNN